MKKWLLLFILLLLPCGALAREETTLMLYMLGGDLEMDSGAASADLRELLTASLPEGLRAVVLTGGSPAWELPGVADGAVQVSEVSQGQISPLACWEDAACADAGTLELFLREYAPAQGNAVLVFWGHGCKGLEGVGYDLLADGDTLTVPEIAGVLAEYPGRISAVGFDACSMATIETAALLSPWTDWLIASPEPEMLSGWPYRSWVQAYDGDMAAWLAALREQTVLRWQRERAGSGLTVLSLRELDAHGDLLKTLFGKATGIPGCTLAELAGGDESLRVELDAWLNGQTLRTGIFGESLPGQLQHLPALEDACLRWQQRMR